MSFLSLEIERALTRGFRFLEVLPSVCEAFLDTLESRTGWAFSIIGGGPDPRYENGAITSATYHTGKTQHGQRFFQWYKDYEDHIAKPFKRFCHTVYREYHSIEVKIRFVAHLV